MLFCISYYFHGVIRIFFAVFNGLRGNNLLMLDCVLVAFSLHRVVLHDLVLYCTAFPFTLLYFISLYYTVQCDTVLNLLHCAIYSYFN